MEDSARRARSNNTGFLTLPRQTPHGLDGTSQLGDVTDPPQQSTKFSWHGVSPRS
jgi:hypothetical protein